jgi:hypothetical protein
MVNNKYTAPKSKTHGPICYLFPMYIKYSLGTAENR